MLRFFEKLNLTLLSIWKSGKRNFWLKLNIWISSTLQQPISQLFKLEFCNEIQRKEKESMLKEKKESLKVRIK